MKRMHKNAKRSAATPSAVVSLALLTHSQIGTNRKFHPNKRHSVTLQNSLLLWYYMDEIAAEHHVFYIWNVGEAALVSSGRRHLGAALPGWLWGNDTSLQPPFSSVQHPPTNNSDRRFYEIKNIKCVHWTKKFLSISPEIGQKIWHRAEGLLPFDFCDFMNNFFWNQPQ